MWDLKYSYNIYAGDLYLPGEIWTLHRQSQGKPFSHSADCSPESAENSFSHNNNK